MKGYRPNTMLMIRNDRIKISYKEALLYKGE